MKRYVSIALAVLLIFLLLCGCAPIRRRDTSRVIYIPVETTPLTNADIASISPTPPASSGVPAEPTYPAYPAYPSPDPDMISQQLAMDIALLNAGVHAEDAKFMQVEFDFEAGIPQFEVDFSVGRTEYEYIINANSGSILYFEIDRD